MKRKLKFISIIALILAIMISFTSSCFAVEAENSKTINVCYEDKVYTVDYSSVYSSTYDPNYIVPSTYDKYFIYKNNSSGVVTLYVSGGDIEFSIVCDNDKKYIYAPGNSDNPVVFLTYQYNSSDDVFSHYSDGASSGYRTFVDVTVLASNYDVLDQNGKVVFQKTPVGVQPTLAPIVQQVPLEETIKEIVGILPIVLIILVGLIGLRKALALLSQTLHNA